MSTEPRSYDVIVAGSGRTGLSCIEASTDAVGDSDMTLTCTSRPTLESLHELPTVIARSVCAGEQKATDSRLFAHRDPHRDREKDDVPNVEQPLPAERHRRIDEIVEIHRVVDTSSGLIPTPVGVEAGIDVLVADELRAARG